MRTKILSVWFDKTSKMSISLDSIPVAPLRKQAKSDRFFYLLGIINQKFNWKEGLCRLISNYNQIDISEMGFSKHWMGHEIWSKGINH